MKDGNSEVYFVKWLLHFAASDETPAFYSVCVDVWRLP